MNTRFIKYDSNGRIVCTGEVPTAMLELQQEAGLTLLTGEGNPASHYVQQGVIMARPRSRAKLVSKTLMGLPVPCVIHINQSSYPCHEPVAELVFDYPGVYQIRVEAFPYLDAMFTVEEA